MVVIPRDSIRRKKRTSQVASGLIAAGILATGVYAIRSPHTFLRALSQVTEAGTLIRRTSHILQNIGAVKTSAINRLGRVHVLERLMTSEGRSGLGDAVSGWLQDISSDITEVQRLAGGHYTAHTLEARRSPLKIINNLHMGVINLARNVEYMESKLPSSATRVPLVNQGVVGDIIDSIVENASPEDLPGLGRIAKRLGLNLQEKGSKATVAKVLHAGGYFDDDDIIKAAIEEVSGAMTSAEKEALRPIASEFIKGLQDINRGRIGESVFENIMAPIETVGRTIKRARVEGKGIGEILAEDAKKAALYKRGKEFLGAEVDPLVRLGMHGNQPIATDLRLSAQHIINTETYLRTSFKIPFANINPLSIISPAGRQLQNQVHYWTPENIPHELRASLGGDVPSTDRGLWLLGGELFGVSKIGTTTPIINQGVAPRKYVAIEAGRYREMFRAMSGQVGGTASRNQMREVFDAAVEGTPVERMFQGMLDSFDLYQNRQSMWSRITSFFTKGRYRPTNYYPPALMRKLRGMSPEDVERFIVELRKNPDFDEQQLMLQLKQYVASGIQGPIIDTSVDTGIGRFVSDIAERINKRAETNAGFLERDIKDPKIKFTDEAIASARAVIEQDVEVSEKLAALAPKISNRENWLNDSDFIGEVMDVLTNDRVFKTGVMGDVLLGERGGTKNLNELRRVMTLWQDHKYDLLQELYTVGQGTQTINPMEHPQMFSFAQRAELAFQRAIAGTDYLEAGANLVSKADEFRLRNMIALNHVDNAMQASTLLSKGPLEGFVFGPSERELGTSGVEELTKKSFSAGYHNTWESVSRIQESRKVFGINTDVGLSGYMDFDDELRYGSLYSATGSTRHPGGGPGYELGITAETYYDPFHWARAASDAFTPDFDNSTLANRINRFMRGDEGIRDFVLGEWGRIRRGARLISEEVSQGNYDLITGYFRQFFPNQMGQATAASVSLYNIASSLSHMLDPIGLGFGSRTYAKGPSGIMSSMMFNRIIPIIGAAMAYNWIDRELEATTGSGLDDRISGQIAGARVGAAAIRDITGMTAATKYMYETFPGMDILGKEVIGTIPVLGDLGLNIGLDESASELREFYSAGYVPVRSGRWWLASKTPWGGGRIAGYQPNWYLREKDNVVRTKKLQAAERFHSMIPSIAPGPGWNPLSPLAGLFDPYWKEKFFYSDRPYPISGPLVNPTTPGAGVINATLGNVIKPQIPLHPAEMRNARKQLAAISPAAEMTPGGEWNSGGMGMLGFQEGGTPAVAPGGGQGTAEDIMTIDTRIGNNAAASYMEASMWSPTNPMYQLGLAEYQTTELIGLRGFAFSMIKENYGTNHPVLEEFNIGNIEQNWWGANMGSGPVPAQFMQETTELLRRFWPHERREVDRYNPLRNTQPTWMPDGSEYFEDFLHGDPYSRGKVPREGIIAGPGFENMWKDELGDVMYLGPRASMIGYDYQKQVEYFLGIENETEIDSGVDYAEIGNVIHSTIQSKLASTGTLVEAERFVRDPESGATGHIDAIVDFGRGEEVIEIKSLGTNRFEGLPAGGYEEHISQLNLYLKQQGRDSGYLYYVNMADRNQTKMIEVQFDPNRYRRDIARAQRAQEEANRIIASGEVSPYQNYSHTARAMILSLSAPWSNEFKEEWDYAITENQDRPWVGEMLSRFKNMSNKMMPRHRFTPYKYLGRADDPTADSFQRLVGPIWEAFAHMDTPFHCIAPWTEIITDSGLKEAQDVTIDDQVLTSTGEYKQVIRTELQPKEKRIVDIKIRSSNIKLTLTDDHPILACKHERKKRITSHGTGKKLEPYGSNPEIRFIKAGELEAYDYLVYKPRRMDNNPSEISPDIARLLGYYAAEGCLSFESRPNRKRKPRYTIFTFHKDEVEYINDVANIIEKAFGITCRLKTVDNTSQIWIGSTKLATFFFENIGCKCDKNVPDQLLANNINRAEFIKGLMRGDGTKAGYTRYEHIGLTQYNIIAWLRDALFNLWEITSAISIYKRIGNKAHHNPLYNLRIGKYIGFADFIDDNTQYIEESFITQIQQRNNCAVDGYILYRIQSITESEYQDETYDIEVEDNDSFSTVHCVVHNTKFLPVKSPLESYERDYIYGEDFGDWGQPVERWMKPIAQSLASKSPLYAIPFGAAVGWMFGNNRGGGIAAARMGAIIAGTLSITGSAYEGITGHQYVPADVRRNRAIEEYFDKLKYIKWASIYNRTQDQGALQHMIRTQYGMDPRSGESIYAVTPSERSYIKAFESETNENNRRTIMQMASRPGRRILQSAWGMDDEGRGESISEYFSTHTLPDVNWEGWQPDNNIDDYKVAYLDYQGIDTHDFGIWEEDLSRVHVSGARFERNIRPPLIFSKDAARVRAENIMLKLGMTRGQVLSSATTSGNRREIQIDVREDMTDEVYHQIINGDIRASI